MTAWRLVPITNGYHILTRVFADTVLVGELTLRREDYGDLAARLGAPQAFDTATGRAIAVSSAEPAVDQEQLLKMLATRTHERDHLREEYEMEIDWQNTVADRVPERYEDDVAQPAIIDRWLNDAATLLEFASGFRHGTYTEQELAAAVDRYEGTDLFPDEHEPDLHEGLHPQPGEAPAAPVPPGVEGWTPSHATPALPGPIAPHGCDDCCAEPGEPHGWPGCSSITAGEAGERTDDLAVPPRTFPDPSYREPDGGGVA